MTKAAFLALGCKVNQDELEALKTLFRKRNFEIVPFGEKADVYVIHTCVVTSTAEKKSRQMIKRAIHTNPKAFIAVSGCYAQVFPQRLIEMQDVDLILGNKNRHQIVEMVEEGLKSGAKMHKVEPFSEKERFEELGNHTSSRCRVFLKIEEGCNNFCSYCIVPYARGPVRSKPLLAVLQEAKELLEKGYKEIVLSGTHIGAYGEDLYGKKMLAELISSLLQLSEDFRLRLGSLDPDEVKDELLEVFGHPRLCPHFHLSLQSGDNRILEKMGRRYDTVEYKRLMGEIRKIKKDAAFTTDVMVGFPGEKEDNFQNTVDFLKEMAFSSLHVFKYSPRPLTAASTYAEQVSPREKERRSKILRGLNEELSLNYAQKFQGQNLEVLAERKTEKGCFVGHSENYLLVYFEEEENCSGKFVEVRVNRVQPGLKVWGEKIAKEE